MDDSEPDKRKKPEMLEYSTRRSPSVLPRQCLNLVLSAGVLLYAPSWHMFHSLGFFGYSSGLPRDPLSGLIGPCFLAVLSFESILAPIEYFNRPHGRIERISLGMLAIFWGTVILLFSITVIRSA